MKNDSLPPLAPGSVAIRFRVEWRGNPARAVPVGVQAVWIVGAKNGRVVWTNGAKARGGRDEFRHVSDRRELISLDGLASVTTEFLSALVAELPCAAAPANPLPSVEAGAGAVGYGPRRRESAPWYQREDDTFPADAPDATNAGACCEHAPANA